MKRFLLLYLATALILFPLDLIWLKFVARDFYASRIGELLLSEPRLGVAAAFYLAYVAGIVWFVIQPNLASGSLVALGLAGAAFGFIAYGTYDLTNLATLRGFSAPVAAVDIAWGMVLTGASALGGAFIATRWFGVAAS